MTEEGWTRVPARAGVYRRRVRALGLESPDLFEVVFDDVLLIAPLGTPRVGGIWSEFGLQERCFEYRLVSATR